MFLLVIIVQSFDCIGHCWAIMRESLTMRQWVNVVQWQFWMLIFPDDRILHDKVQYLARLLLCSTRTLVCTGGSVTMRPRTSRSRSVDTGHVTPGHSETMFTHLAVTALIQRGSIMGHPVLFILRQCNVMVGLVQNWIQLTTDSAAQKAGCPQMYVNDVHGSWYDPSNPVVKSNGSIRYQ